MRLKAGLNQEDVENFGVSWKHYQKIEAGTTNTTLKVLYKLAKAFKCSSKDLLP
jgi:DNA-binding XRE family transcriptional regulator